jgi:hypothetical protein
MAYIITHDPARLKLWRRLFRSYRLPVRSPKPRWQSVPGHPREVLSYDLDAGRLTPKQRERFSRYIARVYNLPLEESVKLMDDGWPIKSDQCEPESDNL